MSSDALILDVVRTPRARRKGRLSSVHPVDLLTFPLRAVVERNRVDPALIEDVSVGCVTQTIEQGWCIARRSILAAGWPDSVPGSTVNRLCGSGSQAVHHITHALRSGDINLGMAAGVEHMTRCPMFSDATGEESPLLQHFHPDLVPQGLAAERMCERFSFSKWTLDSYAARSQERAAAAIREGKFRRSIIPVPVDGGTFEEDDAVRADTTLEGLAALKPVFKEDGRITAGNASAIVDGAAAMLLGNSDTAARLSLKPRARIVSTAVVGSDPYYMLTGPASVTRKALELAGLSVPDINVWEINEAFAPVVLLACQELGLDPGQVNVNGGAIALGHPLGATGVVLLATALEELERTEGRFGLVTLCIGLGMGIATIIERL